MDFLKEIKELEEKGVFIFFTHDFYNDGVNCNFSIVFPTEYPDGKKHQTGWYGDNHEFGGVHEVMRTAVHMAKWFLEGDNLQWFFHNVSETVTKKGHKKWLKKREVERALDEHIKSVNENYKNWCEFLEEELKG